jgi:hypothetical protein
MLKGAMERQSRTSTHVRDVDERARIVACVKRGVELAEEDDAKSTLYALEEQSGKTLEKLVDSPDDFVLALQHLLGAGRASTLKSIRGELLLSSLGQAPLNGRVEEFLWALDKDKASAKA